MASFFYLIGALLLAVLDQVTKQLAVRYLDPAAGFPLWPGVLHFTLTHNTGAAFSILSDSTRLLIASTAAVLALMIGYVLLKRPRGVWLNVSLMLLIGGGIGNLIDRVFLGYVRDFIDVTIINFAVFNFADICAVVGTIMLAFYLLLEELFIDTRLARVLKNLGTEDLNSPEAVIPEFLSSDSSICLEEKPDSVLPAATAMEKCLPPEQILVNPSTDSVPYSPEENRNG